MRLKSRFSLLLGILAVGVFLQGATVFRSGGRCGFGVCFWGPNGHDGVWHLALANQIGKGLPPPNPVFAGERLRNYHWGYDALVWGLHRVSGVSLADLHFRVLPIVFSFLLGALSFRLGVALTGNFWTGFWFAFLNYFANSLGWLVTLWRSGQLGGESLFWAMQSISTLLNPPFALSLVLLLWGFLLWQRWQDNLDVKRLLFLSLIFGLLIVIKAYAFVLFCLALLCHILIIYDIRERRGETEKVLLGSGVVGGLIWAFWLKGSGFPFVFSPLWFVRTLFEAKDRLGWWRPELWWFWQSSWWQNPKFLLLAALGTLVFAIGNFNTRLVGVLVWLKSKKMNLWEIFFVFFVFWGFLIPLFWVQKGTAWNTIQFFYYSLFFANWFLARFLADLSKRGKWWLVAILIFPLLPGNLGSLKDYFSSKPAAFVPGAEVEALVFLAQQPEGVVLVPPYDPGAKVGVKPPLPLYLYESTAYVSAFSGKITFLEDEMNLEITGFPWWERKRVLVEFFENPTQENWQRLNQFARIDYLYLPKKHPTFFQLSLPGMGKLFENKEVVIWKAKM